jgi:hypothetical protein
LSNAFSVRNTALIQAHLALEEAVYGIGTMNAVYLALKESAGQSLFYRQDKMEESPGSIGQGAR